MQATDVPLDYAAQGAAPSGASDPVDTPGQNLAVGLRKDPVGRNDMSGREARRKKHEKRLPPTRRVSTQTWLQSSVQ